MASSAHMIPFRGSQCLNGLTRVEGVNATVPFVRMFYGEPSQYIWEDDYGAVHTILQGRGGRIGDAMMPLLLSLEQHEALESVSRILRVG